MLPLPNMQVIVAKQVEVPVGFAIYWKIESWYFLEHLAIHPLHEGNGYGSQLLQGLQIAPFPYQQPPYRRGETTPAMHILSVPPIIKADLFLEITLAIRRQVFEAFY